MLTCVQVMYLPPPPNPSCGGRGRGSFAGEGGGGGGKRSREEANERVAKGGRRTIERIAPEPYVNVLRRIDTEVRACLLMHHCLSNDRSYAEGQLAETRLGTTNILLILYRHIRSFHFFAQLC
jgi:hypothetical protein